MGNIPLGNSWKTSALAFGFLHQFAQSATISRPERLRSGANELLIADAQRRNGKTSP
jgi:hypothetical protein